MQKVVLLVVVLLVGLYVISNPGHSADMASSAWHWAHHAGQKLASFVNDL